MFVANCVGTDPCLSVHTGCDKQGSVSTQFVTNRDLCPHSLWQTGICVHTICEKQGSVSAQFTLFFTNCVEPDPCLLHIVWTQIPVCHNLCENKSLFVTNCVCGHRSLFVTNCMDTDPCLSQTVCKQGSGSTQFVKNRDLCPHTHTGCDKQGFVSSQAVTNRDRCPHNLYQTGICFHTVYCMDTDPCLS
jgi:hypothetical protein